MMTIAADTIDHLEAENAVLRAQQEQSNEPLTLDELRSMDGEPVWIGDSVTGRWHISAGACDDSFYFECDEQFDAEDYGSYWLAYRHKPEQGDDMKLSEETFAKLRAKGTNERNGIDISKI